MVNAWMVPISREKTKLLGIGEWQPSQQPPITLEGLAVEEVKLFFYLGSEVGQDGKVEKEVAVRLKEAGTAKCGDGRYSEVISVNHKQGH